MIPSCTHTKTKRWSCWLLTVQEVRSLAHGEGLSFGRQFAEAQVRPA